MPLVAVLALAGCVGVVRPTADDVAEQVAAADGDFEAVAPILLAQGYERIDLDAMGGPRPDGTPVCLEKARGNALFGVDVVRICAVDGGVAGLWRMQTHSPDGWQNLI